MALASDYVSGTITIAANATAVTGAGTAWLSAGFQEGDVLYANGFSGIVLTVNSNTSLTLAQPWRGGALNAAAYRLRFQSDGSRVSAQARQLIEMLGGSGNLEAFSKLPGAANKLPLFTGAGTLQLVDLTSRGRDLIAASDPATAYGALGEVPNAQLPARLKEVSTDVVQDCNAVTASGFYRVASGALNAPEAPTLVMLHIAWSPTQARQIAFRHSSNAMYERANQDGTWTGWNRIWSAANLLSSVSMSAGVPSGGVMERGSNSNGEYVRFADGTQIAVAEAVTISQLAAGASQDFSMPTTFSGGRSYVDLSARFSGAGDIDNGDRLSLGNGVNIWRVRNSSTTSMSSTLTANLISIGKWT